MYRYRQNIQKQNFNPLNINSSQQYGITSNKTKQQHKYLKSRCKSHKDILIAKNKQLSEFFKLSNTKNLISKQSKSLKDKQQNIKQKINKIEQKPIQSINNQSNEQYGLSCQKTSFFNEQPKKSIQNIQKKYFKPINMMRQSLASDRAQAQQLKQRLKKSTSMKNLIQQRYLFESNKQKQQPIKQDQNKNQNKIETYDSTKYNWRLSRSKQKLLKQKSLTSLSNKANLLTDFNKKNQSKNKLSLNNNLRTKTQQSNHPLIKNCLSDRDNLISRQTQQNKNKNKLAFTFGSQVFNNSYFN